MISNHRIVLLSLFLSAPLVAMEWLPFWRSAPCTKTTIQQTPIAHAKVLHVTQDCKYNQEISKRAEKIKNMIESALQPNNTERYKPLQDLIINIRKKDTLTRDILDSLGECQCIRFDRARTPEIRGKFEEKMLSMMQSRLPHPQEKTTCAFIGSGDLFSTLIKIGKFLQMGYHNLRVILVDTAYAHYIGQGPNMFTLWKLIEVQFQQYLSYLCRYHYRDSQIEIVVYQDLHHYLADCGENHNNQADLMVIEDLDLSEGHETVLLPAYDHALRPGGMYAILADKIQPIAKEIKASSLSQEQVEIFLNTAINLDTYFGFCREHNGQCDVGAKGFIVLTRQYLGVKKG